MRAVRSWTRTWQVRARGARVHVVGAREGFLGGARGDSTSSVRHVEKTVFYTIHRYVHIRATGYLKKKCEIL